MKRKGKKREGKETRERERKRARVKEIKWQEGKRNGSATTNNKTKQYARAYTSACSGMCYKHRPTPNKQARQTDRHAKVSHSHRA